MHPSFAIVTRSTSEHGSERRPLVVPFIGELPSRTDPTVGPARSDAIPASGQGSDDYLACTLITERHPSDGFPCSPCATAREQSIDRQDGRARGEPLRRRTDATLPFGRKTVRGKPARSRPYSAAVLGVVGVHWKVTL